MQATVNAFLSMQKMLIQRRQQLETVKASSTSRMMYFDRTSGTLQQKEEPTYDIKALDRKVTQINRALYDIDVKIKACNALTSIDVAMDFDNLMAEVE
jgi:hypothetical protein